MANIHRHNAIRSRFRLLFVLLAALAVVLTFGDPLPEGTGLRLMAVSGALALAVHLGGPSDIPRPWKVVYAAGVAALVLFAIVPVLKVLWYVGAIVGGLAFGNYVVQLRELASRAAGAMKG